MKDYRKNQKVVFTIELKDEGQDFLELDVLENGVVLGNSIMFSDSRLSLLGIGTLDGIKYHNFKEFIAMKKWSLKGLFVYLKDTDEKDPLPWKANILNYTIVGVKKAIKPNRFKK